MKLQLIFQAFILLILTQACLPHVDAQPNKTSELNLHLDSNSIHDTQTENCQTPVCTQCKSLCPSLDRLNEIQKRCERIHYIAEKWLHNAMNRCLEPECYSHGLNNACGMIGIEPTRDILEQVNQAIATVNEEINQIGVYQYQNIDKNSQLFKTRRRIALIKVTIDSIVSRTLNLRKKYVELIDYTKSLAHRQVEQEVTRIQFEFRDLYHHLDYWKKEKESLTLAVKTSPEELKQARDRLRKNLKTYRDDADLLAVLQNGSLTKEQKAQLIIALKEEINFQVDSVQDALEDVIEEEKFIKEARREIYNLLRNILDKVNKRQLQIGCGGNQLSSLVTDAISRSS